MVVVIVKPGPHHGQLLFRAIAGFFVLHEARARITAQDHSGTWADFDKPAASVPWMVTADERPPAQRPQYPDELNGSHANRTHRHMMFPSPSRGSTSACMTLEPVDISITGHFPRRWFCRASLPVSCRVATLRRSTSRVRRLGRNPISRTRSRSVVSAPA